MLTISKGDVQNIDRIVHLIYDKESFFEYDIYHIFNLNLLEISNISILEQLISIDIP